MNLALKNRYLETLGRTFADKDTAISHADLVILKSYDDQGVALNGGRTGSRFAAKTILHQLKTLPRTQIWPYQKVYEQDLTLSLDLKTSPNQKLIHLGAGHNDLYQLVKFLWQDVAHKIHLINIDPHLDSRDENIFHSGNPIAKLIDEVSDRKDYEIYVTQVGIKREANALSTLKKAQQQGQKIIYHHEWLNAWQQNELSKQIEDISRPEMTTVISLDCDVIDSSHVPGVSAIASLGASAKMVIDTLRICQNVNKSAILGLYEYNPIYDTLSCQSGKLMAHLIYHWLTNFKDIS